MPMIVGYFTAQSSCSSKGSRRSAEAGPKAVYT
eukprot:CAMPEP_0170642442 /NCGR_PEP_ID=MMETSP0224-20130122/41329_1 /TAXON_ID=285029 /ORGANISM="Togula jolla, Strain CCCM 725" /LENGTH=32 /DNA_ID= /DNA_START= /DNA_END= /DNA_ORIENTATION=